MAAYPDFATAPREAPETPVELLAVGCSLSVADGFANALRNQGQAAHLKTADTTAALEQQLSSDNCDLVVINAAASWSGSALAGWMASNPGAESARLRAVL